MEIVQRTDLSQKLSELFRYGFGHAPGSAICRLGPKVAECLRSEEVSPKEFVGAYMMALDAFMKENEKICLEDYRTLVVARENLIAHMGAIAEKLVSKEFSDQAFGVFKDFLDYVLTQRSSPSSLMH